MKAAAASPPLVRRPWPPRENDTELRGRTRLTKEYPATDKFNNPVKLRVAKVRADHWEAELHIKRIAKAAAGDATAPPVHFPVDTDEETLAEVSNMEQFYDRPDKGNVKKLRWRKKHADKPNDQSDNLRNALVLIEAAAEELQTGRPQL
jgi:hypothetical protein